MKTDRELLKEANELIRSFNSVCERSGMDTHWIALHARVRTVLKEQHEVLYPFEDYTIKEIK
jgi:hypothetical protein